MEISSLIVLRMYPRHRNLEAKQIRSGESRIIREMPSIRKYQLHSIKIQNEPDKVEISMEYYLTTREFRVDFSRQQNLSASC